MKLILGGKMRGQIFELLFYPFLALLLLSFFSFSTKQLISEINTLDYLFSHSSKTIETSNLLLLNRSLDHLLNVSTSPKKGNYNIKRLIICQKNDILTVKELIFPYMQ